MEGMHSDGLKELVSGGVAGVVMWGSIYPLDVLKSRVQARGCSLGSVWSELVASRDLAALTRGMGAMRVPLCVLCAVSCRTLHIP